MAELSIGLLTCLKLYSREFNSHGDIFGYSKVSGFDIIVSWVVSMGNIQGKDLVYGDLASSILYGYVNQ